MSVQILAIVKDTGHFDYPVLAAAVEKELARLLHPGTGDSGSAAATFRGAPSAVTSGGDSALMTNGSSGGSGDPVPTIASVSGVSAG